MEEEEEGDGANARRDLYSLEGTRARRTPSPLSELFLLPSVAVEGAAAAAAVGRSDEHKIRRRYDRTSEAPRGNARTDGRYSAVVNEEEEKDYTLREGTDTVYIHPHKSETSFQ